MMGAKMERDMREELFTHYQKLSFRFYDNQKTGQLMSRLTHDVMMLSEFYHHGPEDLAIGLVTLVGVLGISLTISTELTLVVFIFLPIMTVFALYFNRNMNRALRHAKERIADVNVQVEDTLAGIRVVKSFTNEQTEQRKFSMHNNRFLDSRREDYLNSAYFYGGMIGFTQLITITVIVVGAISLANNTLDLPDLLTFLLYVSVLIEPITRLVNFARLYQEGITGFNRFIDMLNIEPDIQDTPDAIELDHIDGDILFKNVSFRYRDDYPDVLQNINLSIHAGEYVALVGASGVGKSTLCSLIPRFYEVTAGEILIDQHHIKDISLHTLRRHIGVVDQDVYLFSGTVADNIRYGKADATMDEIVHVAKQANAHEFIMALPQQYDTDIGQRGVKLSGGQKQRLSIARVFLKNPPILIFDEATSALDNESEQAVKESLERLTKNRTTLVIAHRLSTVRNAERVIVLTEDGITEQGTHDDLIAQDGTYAKLYHVQARI
jgi:ATP-binding cassette subfamily B protein